MGRREMDGGGAERLIRGERAERRDEFRRHKDAAPKFVPMFLREWEQYAELMERREDSQVRRATGECGGRGETDALHSRSARPCPRRSARSWTASKSCASSRSRTPPSWSERPSPRRRQ